LEPAFHVALGRRGVERLNVPKAGRTGLDPATHDNGNAQADMRRLTLSFAVLYFVQGLGDPTDGLSTQPVQAMLKSWHDRPETIGSFLALASIPWSLKPLYGLLSDFVPIYGRRRTSYLLLAGLLTAGGYLLLAVFPPPEGAHGRLLVGLLLPAMGVALADVVVDALMVEQGQPLGLTGRLQAVQWASIYAAAMLAGEVGGHWSASGRYAMSFWVSAGVGLAMLAICARGVREPPTPIALETFSGKWTTLREALGTPGVPLVGVLVFLFEFNPFSSTVLYLHMTSGLGLSEQAYGRTRSLVAVASIVAAVAYGTYCRRVPLRVLLHLAIGLGVAASLVYLGLIGPRSAMIVSLLHGFTYMTSVLVLLDLAARGCPPTAAGTLFAVVMSLSNLGSSLAMAAGSHLYGYALGHWGERAAFDMLLAIGAATTALCWGLVPWLPSHLLGRAEAGASGESGR